MPSNSTMAWLHKAVDIHDPYVVQSTFVAEYYKLWDEPRFEVVKKRMDLDG